MAAVDLLQRQIEFGQLVNLFSGLDFALVALSALDHPDPAAVLLDKSETLVGAVHRGWEADLIAETEASLRRTLVESQDAAHGG